MHDSGKRQKFATGAVRDTAEGKSRPDLISPFALERLGEWLRLGAEKYSERNWESGIPFSRCIASIWRHLLAYQQGKREEDHLIAILCNAMFICHFEHEISAGRLPVELDDMPKYEQQGQVTKSTVEMGFTPYPEFELGTRRINVTTGMPEVYARLAFKTNPAPCLRCNKTPRMGGTPYCVECVTDLNFNPFSDRPTFYLCGPMRGYPRLNFAAFDVARDLGRALGYHVISPADLDREAGIDPITSMLLIVLDVPMTLLNVIWIQSWPLIPLKATVLDSPRLGKISWG